MNEKHKSLQDKFQELTDLFEQRPSRPEDLDLIKQLQDDIVNKDNQLKKAAEDMKFYKLELINREESYNKMFGSMPSVGVMNPMQAQTGLPPKGGAGIGG